MRDRHSDAHRPLMAAELGRPLRADEVVDHVNEDKTDNSKGNKRVMSRSAHTTMHNKTRGLSVLRSALRMVREKRKLF